MIMLVVDVDHQNTRFLQFEVARPKLWTVLREEGACGQNMLGSRQSGGVDGDARCSESTVDGNGQRTF